MNHELYCIDFRYIPVLTMDRLLLEQLSSDYCDFFIVISSRTTTEIQVESMEIMLGFHSRASVDRPTG